MTKLIDVNQQIVEDIDYEMDPTHNAWFEQEFEYKELTEEEYLKQVEFLNNLKNDDVVF
jgi:hypothetical protein